MLWCAETEFSAKLWLITILSNLFRVVIPNTVATWYLYLLKMNYGFTDNY